MDEFGNEEARDRPLDQQQGKRFLRTVAHVSNQRGHKMHLRAVLRQSDGETVNFSGEAAKTLGRRGSQRRSLTLTAHTGSPAPGELPLQILDISQGGLLLETKADELFVDDQIDLELPECGPVKARVVWRSGHFAGCQFSQTVSPAAISASLLKADRNARELPIVFDHRPGSRTQPSVEPELNFSVPLSLGLVLWGLIGLAAYITVI